MVLNRGVQAPHLAASIASGWCFCLGERNVECLKLTGRGALSEADVDTAMREVRRALLEADVALEVVKTFTEQVRAKAVGQEVVKSIKPGQMVVKIVHDQLVETLGSDQSTLNLRASPPVAGIRW